MYRVTVVTRDRPGLIAEVSELLCARGVNISAMVGQVFGGDAVLQLDVPEQDAALTALTSAGFQAVSDDVLLLRLTDEPGALAKISRRLADAQISIRGINMVQRGGGYAIVGTSTDDNARARELLAADLV
jgi:hypothetical protein